METLRQAHFLEHGQNEEFSSNEQDCHWCQLRALPSQVSAPVTLKNEVDAAVLPRNFKFIDHMVLGAGVEPAEASFRSGCICATSVDCQYSACLCLAELDSDDESMQVDQLPIKKSYAYHSSGPRKGLLRSKLLNSKRPLYECHSGCACSPQCHNRVVERGRTIPLQIFRTKDRGWGVRAQVNIKVGQFVDRYLGEVISSEEADKRRNDSAISHRKDVYLFALDKFTDSRSFDPRLRGAPLEVDGEFMSGPTRFINHSCDPNLRIFARVGDHADKHIHDLALFAIKEIHRGEELTFDYVDGEICDDSLSAHPAEMTRCLCGSPKCRKYLW